MKEMKSTSISYDEALMKAASLCSTTECSAMEIRRKLARRKAGCDDIDKIVDWLIDNNFIDDERFARAFVNDKYKLSLWGRRRILNSLKYDHGIPADIAQEALSDIDDATYRENLCILLQTKYRQLKESGKDEKAQKASLFRLGVSRGYESAMVASRVAELTDGDASDFDNLDEPTDDLR